LVAGVAAQPEQAQRQDDEASEREAWGVDEQAWADAFAWADEAPAPAAAPDGPFAVWRCNWPAIGCWLALETQWQFSPMGRVMGLDYTAVEIVMRRRAVTNKNQMFADLQTMEQAALEVLRG
jgi:hypothetical protein